MTRASSVTDGTTATASQYNAIQDDYLRRIQSPVTYVIYEEDGTVYGEHCGTSGTDFSGTDAATVINDVIDNVSSGKILIRGMHDCDVPIVMKAEVNLTGVDPDSCGLTATTAMADLIDVKAVRGTDKVSITNLKLDGSTNATDVIDCSAAVAATCMLHMDYCFISGGITNALNIGFVDTQRISNCFFYGGNTDFTASVTSNGVNRGGGTGGQSFFNCSFNSYAGSHVKISASFRMKFFGCGFSTLDNTTGGTVNMTYPLAAAEFHGCHFEFTGATPTTETFVGGNVNIPDELELHGCRVRHSAGNYAFIGGSIDKVKVLGGHWLTAGTPTYSIDCTMEDLQIHGLRCPTYAPNFTKATRWSINQTDLLFENSGTSTGTGARETIAHGLAATPNIVHFSDIELGANAYQDAAADANNIYPLAVVNQDYAWTAKKVP